MSRSSSFSIGKGKAGKASLRNASHNDRTRPPSYIIDYEAVNEVSSLQEDVRKRSEKLLRAVEKERAKLGMKKLSTQVYKMKEAVVNLRADSTIAEVNKVADYINEKYGIEILQTAVHKDEGVWIEFEGKKASEWNPDDYHFDVKKLAWYDKEDNEVPIKRYEAGKQIFYCKDTKLWYQDKKLSKPFDMSIVNAKYNYHGHILYWNLDKQGRSISRTLQEELSSIQDKVAEIVKLKRTKSNRKGVEMSTLKDNIRQVESTKKPEDRQAKLKDLKDEVTLLHSQLKERGAQREDYAKLEQLNKEFKQEIKNKTLTIDDLKQRVNLLYSTIDVQDERISILEDTVEKYEKANSILDNKVETTISQYNELSKKNEVLEQENIHLKVFVNAIRRLFNEPSSTLKVLYSIIQNYIQGSVIKEPKAESDIQNMTHQTRMEYIKKEAKQMMQDMGQKVSKKTNKIR